MPQLLTVRPLEAEDGPALAAMLRSQPADYMRYFTPFNFDEATTTALLSNRRQDVYVGMYWDRQLVGFFMLRGWDEGYDVPAYGVVIDRNFRGYGLARLSVEMSKTICRLRRTRRMMLKVHPGNRVAKRIYEEAGFVQTGIDVRNNNLVYHYDL